jgi:Holliday junction DNA helicase RuvA
MISRIEGELIEVTSGKVQLRCDHRTYELLVPASDELQLDARVGQRIEFHTLHYLEGQGQGTSFVPRLIGFGSIEALQFFELFTTVKGLGARKALRALQLPFGSVAQAISAKDQGLLVSLPEIGKRTAETIIAQLHGKVDRFTELTPGNAPSMIEAKEGDETGSNCRGGRLSLINDAVAILVQLGEPKIQARQLVDRALDADGSIESADDLVAGAFQLKALI